MLFKPNTEGNADELRQFAPIQKTIKFEKLASFIRDAEQTYLIPVMSPELYADIEGKYLADTLSPDEQKLLAYAQDALAKYVYVSSLDFSAELSNTGTGKHKAVDWEQTDLTENFVLKRQGFEEADRKIEILYSFLEEKKDVFTLWRDSQSCVEYNQLVLRNAREFTVEASILGTSRRIFARLRSTMQDVQLFYIDGVFSKELREDLTSKARANTLSSTEQTAWDYIKKIFAYQTLADAFPILPFEFNGGVLAIPSFVVAGKKETALDAKQAKENREVFERNARFYTNYLRQHLIKNIANFPLFETSGKYSPPTVAAPTEYKTIFVA
jgi:hypothetical protein